MLDVLTGFDWLEGQLGVGQQVAVTVAAIGGLGLILLLYRQLESWLHARIRPLYADLVSVSVLLVSSALALAIVLGAWGQTDRVTDFYAEVDHGGELLANLAFSVVIVILTYVVVRFARRLLEEIVDSSTAVTEHQREISHRLTQVTLWSVAIVAIAGVWVDDLGGLIVGAGALGIVLGMAARQTLSTILAGFVLMFARPFEIGDWIEIDGEEGIVTDISAYNTRVQTFDGEYVVVPNDVVSSSPVRNRSRMGRLRVEVDVGVDYETDVDHAADLAASVVADLEYAEAVPAPQVVYKGFGNSAILLGVRFWIDDPTARRRSRARTAAIGELKRTFEDEGIEIPYPQRAVSTRTDADDVRIAGGETGERVDSEPTSTDPASRTPPGEDD